MQLPNAARATVDLRKLAEYCLNPEHPLGKHKARVFQAALGLTREHAQELAALILEAVLTQEAASGERMLTASGTRLTFNVPELAAKLRFGRRGLSGLAGKIQNY